MASIFTYDPDPPRVASPWLKDVRSDEDTKKNGQAPPSNDSPPSDTNESTSHSDVDTPSKVTRLHAEPQEGPVEYKLHLLLRPRRKFRSTSTGSQISGSKHSKSGKAQPPRSFSDGTTVPNSSPDVGAGTPPPSSMQQTRQHRLEQLTTQLLWRLQQSSPHHTSSATNIILPSLPEALPELQAPQRPAKLLHGLEESNGALYEIGVADDGTLVGLAEDEMQESLNNLRAMAACLGCNVEVLRKETVGDCEWLEDVVVSRKERRVRRAGKLVVVEAFVRPYLMSGSPQIPAADAPVDTHLETEVTTSSETSPPATEQLRITLTGPTMSGKSSLLGTLTTSTLDNGRGKSRLSMLKHRHEITSGVTSSVTQELIGYQDVDEGNIDVVNYAADDAASWIDIHVAAGGNRLIFISDSAGHPRYRRTTLRGLVGWSPHWTLLCVPADDTEDPAGKTTQASPQNMGTAVPDMDLSGAQLDLCLRLRLPLVVVITKLDLASRAGLKASLTKVLDALKAVGRKPAIIANSSGEVSERELQTIAASVIDSAYNVALPLLNDPIETVPIVLTSAVQGTGITNLHALLHELPIPDAPTSTSGFTFHIEDIYSKPAEVSGTIVSGLLHTGQISVGDTGTLGPFSTQHDLEDSEDSDDRRPPISRSFPGAPAHFPIPNQEWRRFKAISIRNLRLPVHTLFADQVGTIALVPHDGSSPSPFGRIRKGMVLTAIQPQATRSFAAKFKRQDLESLAVGNHVVVYISSIRASARVVSARAPSDDGASSERIVDAVTTPPDLLVTFSFDASKEFVRVGDRVLVMPGGGPGLYGGVERGEKGVAGLEGFVGVVVDEKAT